MLSPSVATHTLADIRGRKLDRSLAEARHCGPDWVGLPHAKLVTAMQSAAGSVGRRLDFLAGDLSKNGADVVMAFVTHPPTKEEDSYTDSEWLLPCVGVTSSNSLKRLLKFYFGYWNAPEECGVCFESFQGPKERWMYKKGFDVKLAATQAMAFGDRAFRHFTSEGCRETLDDDSVPMSNAVALLGEAAESAGSSNYRVGVPWSRIGRAVKDFGSRPRKTTWDLLTAYGRAIARGDPKAQLEQLLDFWDLVKPEETSKIPQEIP